MVKIKAPVFHRVRDPLVVEELELDEPKQGEVLVPMAASGVRTACGRGPAPGKMAHGTTSLHLNGEEVYHYGTVATYASYTVIGATNAVKITKEMPLDRAALIGC